MRISDCSSDVCSSDLDRIGGIADIEGLELRTRRDHRHDRRQTHHRGEAVDEMILAAEQDRRAKDGGIGKARTHRSEEHTSELQSLMRISYAVFCLKKKIPNTHKRHITSDTLTQLHNE